MPRRMSEIKPGRRVVGRDGPPTPETAPWGVRYWVPGGYRVFLWDDATVPRSFGDYVLFGRGAATEWEPLPEPSSEYVSAPEPKPRWSHDRGFIKCSGSPINEAEINAAVDALNTLDRDGVVYGPGRPMEELPDGHVEPVLIACADPFFTPTAPDSDFLNPEVAFATRREDDAKNRRRCWWPLPVPEDTNA